MPRRKPYHPYRNIRRNQRRRQSANISVQPYILPQLPIRQGSDTAEQKFAMMVILAILILIIGGFLYMTRESVSDTDMLQSIF